MSKIVLAATLLLSILFSCCKNREQIDYTVTVIFQDGSILTSSGSEYEDYIKGYCATTAWNIFIEKYPSFKDKSSDDFRFQCWGEGTFNFTYNSHDITVITVIY